MPVVEEKEVVVVVVVAFPFIPSSLFSFVLHFVAFSSSSCCGGSGADVEVVVVVANIVLVVVVVVCSFPLTCSIFQVFAFFLLPYSSTVFSWYLHSFDPCSLFALHLVKKGT